MKAMALKAPTAMKPPATATRVRRHAKPSRATAQKEVPRFVARKGSPFSDEEADVAGREFEKMLAAGLTLSPDGVLERAADPGNPLHDLGFDWNDKLAAHKQRLWHARQLLRSVLVIEITSTVPLRAFHNIVISTPAQEEDEDGLDGAARAYKSREVVLKDDTALMQLSRQFYVRIVSAVREAEGLGLGDIDKAWRRIIDVVHRNEPLGIRD